MVLDRFSVTLIPRNLKLFTCSTPATLMETGMCVSQTTMLVQSLCDFLPMQTRIAVCNLFDDGGSVSILYNRDLQLGL